jgi:O-antigen ligase
MNPTAATLETGTQVPRWPTFGAVIIPLVCVFLSLTFGIEFAIALLIGAGSLFFLGRPQVYLLLVIALVAFEPLSTIAESRFYDLTAIKLVGYLLGLSLLVAVATGRIPLRYGAPEYWLLAFLLGLLVSFGAAESIPAATEEFLRFVQLAVLFVAVRLLLKDWSEYRRIGIILLLGMSLSATFAIYQYATGEFERVSGLATNAAVLAADLMVAVAFGFVVYKTEPRGGRRLLWGGLIALCFVAILLTASRAGVIALIVAALAVAVVRLRAGQAIALTLAVLLAGIVFAPKVVSNLERTVYVGDNSTRVHLETLKAGIMMVEDHPLFGVGLGNFPLHYLGYSHDPRPEKRTAHNTYLAIASEAGLGTLLIFLIFVGTCTYPLLSRTCCTDSTRCALREKWVPVLLFSVVALLVFSFFHSLRASKFFWLVLALAPQVTRVSRQGPSQ